MKPIKLCLILLVLVGFLVTIGVSQGVDSQVGSFLGQTNPFNITFTGNENQSFILGIPSYAYAKNVSLSIIDTHAFMNFNKTEGHGLNQGLALSCDGNGAIGSNITMNISVKLNRVRLSTGTDSYYNIKLTDSNFNLIANVSTVDINNIADFSNLNVHLVRGQSYYILFNCTGSFWYTNSPPSFPVINYAYNWTQGIIGVSNNNIIGIVDLTYNITTNTSIVNSSIFLNNNFQFNYSSNVNKNISLNISLLNSLLSLSQPINLTFHSDTAGILQVNLTNSTYGYAIDNCTGGNLIGIPSNATSLNVSFYDSNNKSLNINYQSTTTYYNSSYSLASTSINRTSFCVYPNWFISPQQTQFLYTDSFGVGYSYFLSTNFSNATQLLSLFTGNGTTQVTFTVLNLDGNPLANYKIQILLYNVGTGTYTTTEILQTDSQGHAIGNIVLNNAFYNFLIYDTNNILVATKSAIRVTSTTYQITISGVADAYYTDIQNSMGVDTNIYFNNDTNNFVFTWSDPTGGMHLACLNVINSTYLGSSTMYDSCVESTAGTIIYQIFPKNDTQYLATAYLKYGYKVPVGHAAFHILESWKLFNVDLMGGLFIGTLLIMVGILIALPNPVLSMIYFILVIIVDVVLGLFRFADIPRSYYTRSRSFRTPYISLLGKSIPNR